ncbi:hypothetical protein [Herbiconiux daphne]|uniref:Tetratricopeptide repeat protein n=1 Tax=Herbiconiux daphne TaxID=2970914 RepID=A0ABT2H0P2_9MICO|nr:hypothetical protein [Herbiconiux daphne]MCS5733495.1 hypothetical protein [Herbiconiux daphne]
MSDQSDLRATFRRGDSDAVEQMARAARATAQADGDAAGEVEAVYALARVALRDGDLPRAAATAREALDIAQRSGDLRLEERPRHVLAAVARLSGDHAEARE